MGRQFRLHTTRRIRPEPGHVGKPRKPRSSNGWQLWCQGRALVTHDRKGPQAGVLEMRHTRCNRIDQQLHQAGNDIGNRQRRDFVRHMGGENARLGLECFCAQMHDGAVAATGMVELAGALFGIVDQLGDCFHR